MKEKERKKKKERKKERKKKEKKKEGKKEKKGAFSEWLLCCLAPKLLSYFHLSLFGSFDQGRIHSSLLSCSKADITHFHYSLWDYYSYSLNGSYPAMCIRIISKGCWTRLLGPIPRVSDSVGLGQRPRTCISIKFSGAADTISPGTTLWEPLL